MAGAWKFFSKGRHNLGTTINLSSDAFYLHLFTTLSSLTAQFLGSIANGQIASYAGDYVRTGLSLASPTWVSSAANTQKFDTTDPAVVTASTTAINSIKYAVIRVSGASNGSRKLLCYSTLTTAAFNLAKGNTLQIAHAAGGVFTLS